MDLLSTLIKRPISLVLNTTPPSSLPEHQTRKSPSPGLEHRPATPQNSLFASAINASLMESSSPPPPPTQSLSETFCAFEATTPTQPLLLQHSCSTSSSSASTSNTIEELLIQINDNLNQANLSDVATPEELSPSGMKPIIGSGGGKLTPTTPTILAHSPLIDAATAAAAAAPTFEVNSTLNQFHIDHGMDDVVFDGGGHLQRSFNKNAGINLAPRKFIGLTEFDESSIPELPGGLSPGINEHINLTFEEGLIPTLTANVNNGFNSTIQKDADEENNKTQLLAAKSSSASSSPTAATAATAAAGNDTDTAVSSDNETFSECQSFNDAIDTTNDLVHTTNAAEISELETYRSAINSYNNTVAAGHVNVIAAGDQLNVTMENVAAVTKEPTNVLAYDAAKLWLEDPLLQQAAAAAVASESFGDEPMDVDMDSTQDLQNAKNITMQADQLVSNAVENIRSGANNASGMQHSLQDLQQVSSGSQDVAGGSKQAVTGSQHLNITIEDHSKPQHVSSGTQNVASVSIGMQNIANGAQHGTIDSQHVVIDLQHVASGSQQVGIDTQHVVIDAPDVASGSQHVALAEHENLGALSNLTSADRLTFSISSAQLDLNDAQPIAAVRPSQIQATNHDLSANRNYIGDKSVIQDNSVDSASDAFPELAIAAAFGDDDDDDAAAANILPDIIANQASTTRATIEHDLVERISSTAIVVEEEQPKDALPKVMTATFTKSHHDAALSQPAHAAAATSKDAKQNLVLDFNAPFNSAKSSASNSPIFPLKEPKNVHHFPHSPTAKPEKSQKETFLEKSENAERINAAEKLRKTSVTQKPPQQQQQQQQQNAATSIKITAASPKNADKINGTNSTATSSVLNDTFDDSVPKSLDAEPNRLTFNVAQAPSPALEDHRTEFTTSDVNRRRTYNLSESTTTTKEPLNATYEAMDIDDTTSSTTISTMVTTSFPKSPPIPALQQRQTVEEEDREENEMVNKNACTSSPSLSSSQQPHPIEVIAVPAPQVHAPMLLPTTSLHRRQQHSPSPSPPPLPGVQKCSDIETVTNDDLLADRNAIEMLSAKEKTSSDEKDVIFVNKHARPHVAYSAIGGTFSSPSETESPSSNEVAHNFVDADFQNNGNLILNPCDFDYLLTKGNNNVQVDRSSLLLRFDPLLGVPVPVNQPQQQQQQLLQLLANASSSSSSTTTTNNNYYYNNNASAAPCLIPTIEEDEPNSSSSHCTPLAEAPHTASAAAAVAGANSAKLKEERSAQDAQKFAAAQEKQKQQLQQQYQTQQLQHAAKAKKNVRMSVEVIKDMNIDNDCKKSFENSNSQSDEKQSNFKMDELEKKIKNEVLKTEDIEKKLKEAEQREEALIKRITEKDKTISKMNGVIEAYEKAIAELISEKEQLIQNYEQQLAEVKADRDSNYHHLTSLETTFSDLHVKYEKSKEMTSQLKSSEESLLAEKRQNLENLRLQEQRYEKMKNHAMQQLEIANRKLESLTKEHAIESTKLKALLKKEEISRASINEQLSQKSRENAELVKICDELINGQGS